MNSHEDFNDLFLPERIDEQITYLASIRDAQRKGISGAPTVAALQNIYKDDEGILERAWARIIEADSQPPRETMTIVPIDQNQGAGTMQESEIFAGGTISPERTRYGQPAKRIRHRVWSVLGLVAAVTIVLVNIFAWGSLRQTHQNAPNNKISGNKVTPIPMGKQLCSFSGLAQGLYVSWSAQGKLAISSPGDLEIINASNCVPILTYRQTVENAPHTMLTFRGLDASWSPDGQRLVVAGAGASILDAKTGKVLLRYYPGNNMWYGVHSTEVYTSAWSPDGKYIASIVDTDVYHLHAERLSVQIWDASSGKLIRTLVTGLWNGVYDTLAWSPDGRYIAVGEARTGGDPFHQINSIYADTVYIWKASSGQLVVRFNPLTINSHQVKIDAHLPPNEQIAWSPDSKFLATASQDVVQGWDIMTGKELYSFNAKRTVPGITSLTWSPDGRYLAMAGYLNVRLWNVHTRKFGYTYVIGNNMIVTGVSWSPNSTMLATMEQNVIDHNASATLRIWGTA